VNNSSKITIFGRDHESKGEIYFQAWETFNIALAMSVGVTAKSNEDAIGAAAVNSEIVIALADGHWGRDASELAISKAVELLHPDVRPSMDSETRARLFALFEQVNTELYNMAVAAPGAATPETTLIVCHLKETSAGKYLYWSSFGDSYLFLLRKEHFKQLNTLNSFWLGYPSKLSENADTRSILMKFLSDEARYVGVPSGLETGIEKLEPGDIIFLCTDGLIGSDRDPEQAVLEEIKDILGSDQPLLSKAKKAVTSALNRGEVDNISCVMTQVS
jgi:serine/threonine protein phosphatase PrpC